MAIIIAYLVSKLDSQQRLARPADLRNQGCSVSSPIAEVIGARSGVPGETSRPPRRPVERSPVDMNFEGWTYAGRFLAAQASYEILRGRQAASPSLVILRLPHGGMAVEMVPSIRQSATGR